jgi:hypothetical protein
VVTLSSRLDGAAWAQDQADSLIEATLQHCTGGCAEFDAAQAVQAQWHSLVQRHRETLAEGLHAPPPP